MAYPPRPRDWQVASELRRRAQYGTYSGFGTPADLEYIGRCGFGHTPTGTKLIFTRDVGMHASGWWKNPDYERCEHLSLAFYDPETLEPTKVQNKKLVERWCRLFFRDACRLLWIEPPGFPEGKARAVWHYRLFMDESWTVPLLPRGEVYSREFTEKGWKSWSDLHGQKQESAHE